MKTMRNTRNNARASRASMLVICAAAAAAPQSVLAATADESHEEIVVMGSRLPKDLSSMPGSIQLIDIAEIEKHTALSNDIGKLLEAVIPGMATNQNDASNFTNVIRGREPAYLIDGFPQTLPLRGGGRDMRIIDPSAIERVEIIRGATSLYGQGGAGGYINYITRRPTPGQWNFTSEVGIGLSLSNMSDDSSLYQVRQLAMGGTQRWDVLFSGFFESIGVAYDGQGDAIPPDPFQQGGVSEADSYNLLGKLGLNLAESQRLEATVNYYKKEQDTDVVGSTAAVTGRIKSQPVPKNSPNATQFGRLSIDPYTENLFAALNYLHENVFGSAVKVQGMYQDYLGSFPSNPAYAPNGGTSTIEGQKYAARLDITTPLAFANGHLLWGVEWTEDTTGQTVLETGGTIMPLITLDSTAAFVQVHSKPLSWLTVNGGVRYEDAKLDVPDYQQTLQYVNARRPELGFRPNRPVEGGQLSYADTLFNVGVNADVTDKIAVFAAFSQGFTVTDIGRVLRTYSGGSIFDRVGETDAQLTDNYELGVRLKTERLASSLTLYRNTSDLGSSWDPITLELQRSPERVWGVEVTADVTFESVRFGGTLGWAGSKVDEDDNGTYESKLNYWRIPPTKLTAYVEYDFLPSWTLRLQGLRVDSSNRFPDVVPYSGSATSPIKGYTVFDLSAYGKAGPGTLSIGVQNLFNKEYFSVLSQTATASRPELYTMAPGATLMVKYRINY